MSTLFRALFARKRQASEQAQNDRSWYNYVQRAPPQPRAPANAPHMNAAPQPVPLVYLVPPYDPYAPARPRLSDPEPPLAPAMSNVPLPPATPAPANGARQHAGRHRRQRPRASRTHSSAQTPQIPPTPPAHVRHPAFAHVLPQRAYDFSAPAQCSRQAAPGYASSSSSSMTTLYDVYPSASNSPTSLVGASAANPARANAETTSPPQVAHGPSHQQPEAAPGVEQRDPRTDNPAVMEAVRRGGTWYGGEISLKHMTGICSLSAATSWQDTRSVAITHPISVNDLHILLRRAPNLEYAYIERVVRDTGNNREWEQFDALCLQTLNIGQTEVPVGGIFRDMQVYGLRHLHIGYAPNCSYYLWSDEPDLYRFLRRGGMTAQGTLSIEANDDWYREERAAQLRQSLKHALGPARSDQWILSVPSVSSR